MTPASRAAQRPTIRHRLEGKVEACTNSHWLCVRCNATRPQHMAQLTSGWLPICADCLVLARKAQVKLERKVPLRDKAEKARRRLEYEKDKLTVSGGGANGTGRRAR